MINPLFLNPFYSHPCQEVLEDHARHVIVHQYTGCVTTSNSWVVPEDNQMIWVDLPAMVDVLVGSCLWSPLYGYFKILAWDSQGQKVRIQRKSPAQTIAAGTSIPGCAKFIFTPDI